MAAHRRGGDGPSMLYTVKTIEAARGQRQLLPTIEEMIKVERLED